MESADQGSSAQRGQRLRRLREAARELSRYLISLRVPVGLLALALVAFLTQQLSDVLLAMALEPEWGEFGLAALTAAVFGTALWFSARSLSEQQWMRRLSPEAQTGEAPPTSRRQDSAAAPLQAATPALEALPDAVVWWLPRSLGMAPALLMGVMLLWRVGAIGMARWMALLLILEAGVLLWLFYARTRVPAWLAQAGTRLRRIPLAIPLLRLLNRRALIVPSGNRIGLFSSRTELVLMGLSWMILALISVPMARAAYGPLAGGSLHLYGILLGGAAVLALDRWFEQRRPAEAGLRRCSDPIPARQYWISFALVLLLALLLPPLITASGISGVAIPRYLGSIAILYASLAIFTVFASSFFLFGSKTGVPLLSLLLIGALVLASLRINDNHAVRLLAGAGAPTLPPLQQSVEAWLNRDGRRQAIEASGTAANPSRWPIYVASAQGGGVYAAYHAAKALALLSQAVPAFPEHLFAISGVSGGSVGSTLYVNALRQARSGQDLVDRIDQTFDRDQLSPVLAAMLFQDTAQRFYPVPVPAWDRTLGLELSFSDGGAAAGAPVSLEGSFYGDQAGPFLVLNTTEVQSGRRLLLSPFTFNSDSTFHVPDRQDVRFSTAAVMSARFPLITPYAFFDGSEQQRQRRSVDGGYYDNSGAVTAEEIVQALEAVVKRLGLQEQVEVVPIAIVGIGNYQAAPSSDSRSDPAAAAGAGSSPLLSLSAVDALFAARDARVAKALSDYNVRCGPAGGDGLCITLQTQYRFSGPSSAASGPGQAPAPRAVAHEGAGAVRQIPLGWTLSCQARAFITSQLAVAGQGPLPCLSRQDATPRLEPAGPVAGRAPGIPSFEAIVQRVRRQVEPSPIPPSGRG